MEEIYLKRFCLYFNKKEYVKINKLLNKIDRKIIKGRLNKTVINLKWYSVFYCLTNSKDDNKIISRLLSINYDYNLRCAYYRLGIQFFKTLIDMNVKVSLNDLEFFLICYSKIKDEPYILKFLELVEVEDLHKICYSHTFTSIIKNFLYKIPYSKHKKRILEAFFKFIDNFDENKHHMTKFVRDFRNNYVRKILFMLYYDCSYKQDIIDFIFENKLHLYDTDFNLIFENINKTINSYPSIHQYFYYPRTNELRIYEHTTYEYNIGEFNIERKQFIEYLYLLYSNKELHLNKIFPTYQEIFYFQFLPNEISKKIYSYHVF